MADYRIYLTNIAGNIFSGQDYCGESDEDAFAQALRTIGNSMRAEIWCGRRSVGAIMSPSRQEPASEQHMAAKSGGTGRKRGMKQRRRFGVRLDQDAALPA